MSPTPGWILAAVLSVLILTLPLWASDYLLALGIMIGLHAIVSMGLTLLMGFAGQVSLGQAGFMGIGAYTSGILTVHLNWDPWLAMVAAMVLTSAIAGVVGYPTLNLKAHYLALGTLAIGFIVYIVLKQLGITGGASGLIGIPTLQVAGFKFNTDARFHYVVWSFVAVSLILARNLVASPIGRDLRALAGSEVALRSVAVSTHLAKVRVFMLSAAFSSVAGSLLAHYSNFISPSSFGVEPSVRFLVMATLGGLGNMWGPLIGATAVNGLIEFLRAYVPVVLASDTTAEIEIIAFGLILVLTLKYLPEGLTGLADRLGRGESNEPEEETVALVAEVPAGRGGE